MVGWSWLTIRCSPRCSGALLLSREKIRWEKLMDEHKGSRIKQRLRMEAKENRFTLYFPSAGNVQPLPRKQGFKLLWKTNVIKNAPFFLPLPLLFLGFHCWADVIRCGTSLWIVWVSCPGYVLSQGECWRYSCDAVPANTKVLPTPFQLPAQSTALRADVGKTDSTSGRHLRQTHGPKRHTNLGR